MDIERATVELLEIIRRAIDAGDWEVDSACDPDSAIEYASAVLRSRGWIQNSIDHSWIRPRSEHE